MSTAVAPLHYPTAWPTSPTSPTSDCTVKSQAEMRYADGVVDGGDCVNGAQYLAERRDLYGFRLAENIKWALDAECYFYSRVPGLDLADSVEPVPIDNL